MKDFKNKFLLTFAALFSFFIISTSGLASAASSSGAVTSASDNVAAYNFRGKCESGQGQTLTKENCSIVAYVVLITNVLSGLVGVVIVIMIAVGGIQYTMSRDDPSAVSAAKNKIRNAVFALVIYIFGFAFLQWLIPGGIV